MRVLFIIIVIAAAGYIGFTLYEESAEPADQPQTETAPSEVVQAEPAPTAITPPFKSKIPAPESGEKRTAPPGIFYMLDRVSVETKTGIRAVVPGDELKLLQRRGDGTLKLTDGVVDIVVKESQVTNDLDVAKAAEEKEFMRSGARR